MYCLPVVPNALQHCGVEVGIQKRLRKNEIDVGRFAPGDELRRDQVEPFIPDKGHRLGVDENTAADQQKNTPEQSPRAAKLLKQSVLSAR